MLGAIAYRLPSIVDLFGLPQSTFDQYWSMTFTLSLVVPSEFGPVTVECAVAANCKIVYQKQYTPIVYYLSPPVVYKGAEADIWFNAKATPNLIADLATDDLPFINTKIENALMDFDGIIDSTTIISVNSRMNVRGRVTDQPLSNTSPVTMMWETGKSLAQMQESTTCNYDQTLCYQARTLPVIYDINTHSSYLTGG